LTVVKVSVRSLPAPVPAASSRVLSAAARIVSPSTCSVIVSAPGIGPLKNRYAAVLLLASTIEAGSTAPVESVAKNLAAVTVLGLTARENVTSGRNVTPTSVAFVAGVTLVTVSGGNAGNTTCSVLTVVSPAASVADSRSVCTPAVSAVR